MISGSGDDEIAKIGTIEDEENASTCVVESKIFSAVLSSLDVGAEEKGLTVVTA